MSGRAVCGRCGVERPDFRAICPGCGHRPDGEGVLVAWLLSSRYLSPAQLDAAADRIRAGELIQPSERMLAAARRALGRDFSTDPGLSGRDRFAVLATSLLLTPLVGWTLWWWWREERPRAAAQALGFSLPATLIFTVGVVWMALET
jgi:hypothetical protein